MSGHSKWSKVKHKKAATDAKKSKEFSRVVQMIKVELKKSGGDVNAPGVRVALEKARAVNMPKDNIDRAIAAVTLGTDATESVTYEAYGPGGAALMIETATDNKNRTSAEVRHALAEHGLALANPGAAAWAFEATDDGLSPKQTIPLKEEDRAQLAAVIETLEDIEDVITVYSNAL